MIRMLVLVFGVLVAVRASAQPPHCGDYTSHTEIHGCLDYPPAGATISASYPMIIFGWTLNIETAQQPADVLVYQTASTGEFDRRTLHVLSRDDYFVFWRLERPDVLGHWRRTPNVRSKYLGYAIVIKAGVLPEGSLVVGVEFSDPSRPRDGVNLQRIQITVVP